MVGVNNKGFIDTRLHPKLFVDMVFEDFDLAKEYANMANKEISADMFTDQNGEYLTEDLDEIKSERYSELDRVLLLEKEISAYTADVPISSLELLDSKGKSLVKKRK